eukprot:CCRYP_008140-RA/>CCRYP_008140-RA protein AED:0.44 eAED:0.52 QI:65/0/0/1/0/0/2/0/119
MQVVICFFTQQDRNHLARVEKPSNSTLVRISFIQNSSNNIVSTGQVLAHLCPQVNSIYKCDNTRQFINFYYATMGYPVISTWLTAIDRGYFRGWRGLTSNRVRRFIKPFKFSELGHMDQ